MSIRLIARAWDLALTPSQLLVYVAFASHVRDSDVDAETGGGGTAFPSIARVAWMTGHSDRQVRRVVRALEERRLLVKAAGEAPGRPAEYLVLADGPLKEPWEAVRDRVRAEKRDRKKARVADVVSATAADGGLSVADIPRPGGGQPGSTWRTSDDACGGHLDLVVADSLSAEQEGEPSGDQAGKQPVQPVLPSLAAASSPAEHVHTPEDVAASSASAGWTGEEELSGSTEDLVDAAAAEQHRKVMEWWGDHPEISTLSNAYRRYELAVERRAAG